MWRGARADNGRGSGCGWFADLQMACSRMPHLAMRRILTTHSRRCRFHYRYLTGLASFRDSQVLR